MDEESSHQSHVLRWTLGVLAALLLYVLSWGPFLGLMYRGTIPDPLATWLINFYQPVFWLVNNTPLEKPLEAYCKWWIANLAKP